MHYLLVLPAMILTELDYLLCRGLLASLSAAKDNLTRGTEAVLN
jgi:hypothetical protein